ncbi:MAG: DUF1553 domain-containing protein [Acidobacteria bacterium]|nr:DUF1553 domain-containing protein [Acidobacteriota bacterium]
MRLSVIAVTLAIVQAGHAEIRFNRDIRPIMAATCYQCHGPDASTRMAGLRLDLREEALRRTQSGVTPIVPGDPAMSAVMDRVFSTNAARVMPPKHVHKDLTQAQKDALRQWIAEGAKYESHWAYEPVRRPAVPDGSGNPIDGFIAARLQREGIVPAPEANRRTLIRRVSLDLTGIPPTPAEIREFENDRSPAAYENLVDRLLSSRRYAEKQALYWLDAIRYADTCGFHGDNPFPAWPYRDYVLNSFLSNKPFDQFTREQIAGDLLPGGAVEARVASAYNRMNRTSAEGGLQPKEYLAKYAADRVRTTTQVWLGSTLGCAECHDHKFDPFTARDFYSFKAFFADIKETGLVPDRGAAAWGSQLALPSPEQKLRLGELDRRLEAARAAVPASPAPEWEKSVLDSYTAGELQWHYQKPVAAEGSRGSKLEIFNDRPVHAMFQEGASIVSEQKNGDGLVIASGPVPDSETYTITLRPGAGRWTALAVEAVQDESLAGVRAARGSDRLVISEVEAEVNGVRVPFDLATSNLTNATKEHPAMATIDGDPATGWGMTSYGHSGNMALALRFAKPVETTEPSSITVQIRHDTPYRRALVGRLRLALSRAVHAWPHPKGLPDALVAALRKAPAERTTEQKDQITSYFRWTQPGAATIEKLEAERGMIEFAIPRVVVTESVTPEPVRILPRGNWMDGNGAVVDPAIPAFLGRVDTGRRLTRLDLAAWLVSRNNPLTARVWVNRTWRQLFGTGLSRVLDDVGSQGEHPVHAELLDWLAAEFMEKWDMRHIVRTIVLSKTYRQSSDPRPDVDARDPGNRLLSRQSKLRVEAELVRDIVLWTSGLLTEKFGGPSIRPHQPEGFLAALNFPKRDYSASRGEDLYRRGLYVQWQRTFLHPEMAAFDAPTREECSVNRATSNTPVQALVLLNDPTYVEAARVFAQNMWKDGGKALNARIGWAFQRAVGRSPDAVEQRVLTGLYQESLRQFKQSPTSAKALLGVGDAPAVERANAAEMAALTSVARAILNTHEVITRN